MKGVSKKTASLLLSVSLLTGSWMGSIPVNAVQTDEKIQQEFYVSVTGSDSGDGSQENPFATVKITQAGTSTTYSLSYTWFGQTEFTLEGDGDEVDLGYYLAYLDGSSDFVPDSTEEIYGVVEYEVESSEEWLTVRTTGNNHPTGLAISTIATSPEAPPL